MKFNHTTRGKIWEMYSQGATKKRIQMKTGLQECYISGVIEEFYTAERMVAKDRERKIIWGDDPYSAALMQSRNIQPDFVLLTENQELLELAKKLNYIQ